jgi:general secretion pathway protein G
MATKAIVMQVSMQIDLFRLDLNRYPATLDDLVRRPADIDPSKWRQYLKEKPVDGWGRDLIYLSPTTNGGRFELGSLGRDSKEGGTGLDEDIWHRED